MFDQEFHIKKCPRNSTV